MPEEIIEVKKPEKIDDYMNVPLEFKGYRQDDDFFYFDALLSTFENVDLGDDVVHKGAFEESLKVHEPILLWMHKQSEPLGIFSKIKEDNEGLPVTGKMPLDDTFVRERVIPQIKVKSVKSMSIGYSIWGDNGVSYEKGIRHLWKLFLWEGSLVAIPMNPKAILKTKCVSDVEKNIDIASRDYEWDEEKAFERIKGYFKIADGDTINDEDTKTELKKCFLWTDVDELEYISSYKFLIMDIVDGKLMVIPKAIFNAAAKINNTKSEFLFDEDDKPAIVKSIDGYYDRMNLDSPFRGKIFRIDDLKALDPRTLEKLFKTGCSMSKMSAMQLISGMKLKFMGDKQELDNNRDDESKELADLLESIKLIKI